MNTAIAARQISVKDYHQMAESGILRPDERVELLAGQVYPTFAALTLNPSPRAGEGL